MCVFVREEMFIKCCTFVLKCAEYWYEVGGSTLAGVDASYNTRRRSVFTNRAVDCQSHTTPSLALSFLAPSTSPPPLSPDTGFGSTRRSVSSGSTGGGSFGSKTKSIQTRGSHARTHRGGPIDHLRGQYVHVPYIVEASRLCLQYTPHARKNPCERCRDAPLALFSRGMKGERRAGAENSRRRETRRESKGMTPIHPGQR